MSWVRWKWQLTEASKASRRLTLLICEHTYTSTHQALRWKQATSRAMLLHVRFGTTVPQAAKSGAPPCSRSVMCRTTGTERLIASNSASGPSTFAKGVRTPPANQTSVLTAVRIDAPFLVRQGSDRGTGAQAYISRAMRPPAPPVTRMLMFSRYARSTRARLVARSCADSG